ncbi:MAG TPA: hypothetical protein VGF94_14525 [Kofleriaceae bacterium]
MTALETLRDRELAAAQRHPWWPEWERERAAVADVRAAMTAELRRAISTYPPCAAVRLYFAGADVEPYVASEVWADGLAELVWAGEGRLAPVARVFREAPAFEPRWLRALCDAAIDDAALAEHEDLAAMARFVTLDTLVLATACLAELGSDAVWLASPGHDSGTLVLIGQR